MMMNEREWHIWQFWLSLLYSTTVSVSITWKIETVQIIFTAVRIVIVIGILIVIMILPRTWGTGVEPTVHKLKHVWLWAPVYCELWTSTQLHQCQPNICPVCKLRLPLWMWSLNVPSRQTPVWRDLAAASSCHHLARANCPPIIYWQPCHLPDGLQFSTNLP